MADKFKIDGLKEATAEFDKMNKKANESVYLLLKMMDISQQLTKDFKKIGSLNSYKNYVNTSTEAIEKQKKAVVTLTDAQKRLERAKKNLVVAQSKENTLLQSTRLETNKLNKEKKTEIILASKGERLLKRVSILREKERAIVQDLNLKKQLGIKLEKAEIVALKKATKQFDKYDKAIRRVKKDTGQLQENVGNYPKQLKIVGASFMKLIPLLGAGLTFKAGLDFLRDARQMAVEAKGVEFAFKRLGEEGQSAFDKIRKSTRGLVSDLAIKKTINEFDNFNLKLSEMDTLMEFAAVRSEQTGNSIEYMLESLKEGLSKGSLRRLDNLGISIKDMKTEMKDFGLTVQEAFAKLAGKEVKRAGRILDDAQNNQKKWNANLENFKLLVGNSLLAKVSDGFYSIGSNILRMLTPTKSLTEETRKQQNELFELESKIKNVNTSSEDRIRLIKDLQTKYPDYLKNINAETVSNNDLSLAIKEINNQLINKIILLEKDDELQAQNETTAKKRIALLKAEDNLRNQIALTAKRNKATIPEGTYSEQASFLINKYNLITAEEEETQVTSRLAEAQSEYHKALGKLNVEEEKSNDLLSKRQALKKKLFGDNDPTKTSTTNTITTVTDDGCDAACQKKREADRKARELQIKKDAQALAIFKLSENIKSNQAILDNDKSTYVERLKASEDLKEAQFKLIKAREVYELESAKTKDGVELIQLKAVERIEKAKSDSLKRVTKITEKELDKQAKLRKEHEKELQKAVDKLSQNDLNDLNKKYLETNLTIEEYEKEKVKIKRKYAKQILLDKIKYIELELKAENLNKDVQVKLAQELYNLKSALLQQEADDFKKTQEEKSKAQKEREQVLKDSFTRLAEEIGLSGESIQAVFDLLDNKFETTAEKMEAFGQIAVGVFQAVIQASNDNLQNQIENLEIERESVLENEQLSAEQKEMINDKFARRKAKLEEKQAKNEKALALFSAIINTAAAIVKVLPNYVEAAIVAALGLVQIAAISAQKAPTSKFATGTQNAPEGWAQVDEQGAEIHTDKYGNIKDLGSDKGTRYKYLNKGDKIFTASQTKDIKQGLFSDSIMQSVMMNGLKVGSAPIIINQDKGITKDDVETAFNNALKKQPKHLTVIDKHGISQFYKNQSTTIKLLNNPYGL